MASQRVFDTAELIEGILVLLPLAKLLQVQAVCKHWKDIMKKSSVLQEALFLRPTKQTSTWLVDVTNLPFGSGPLHRRYPTHLRVKAAVSPKSHELNEHHGLIVTPVHINPLCLQLKDQDQPEGSSPFETEIKVNKGTPLMLSSGMMKSDSQRAGSWQDMFLTQPPVQYVTLEVGPENNFDTLQLWVNRLSMRRERRTRAGICKVFVEEGIRFRHVLLEGRKVLGGGPPRISDHIIVMHGAIAATNEDEAVVKSRTKEWLNNQAYDI